MVVAGGSHDMVVVNGVQATIVENLSGCHGRSSEHYNGIVVQGTPFHGGS